MAQAALPDMDWRAADVAVGEFHDIVLADGWPSSTSRVAARSSTCSVEPGLVHGDLAGTNLLWRADGTVSRVLDWDLAQAFDPAVDAEQCHRARV